MKNKKISGKSIFNWAVIILSLFILVYFAFSKDGLKDLTKNIPGLNFEWIIIAVICNLINIAIDAYLIYIFTRNSLPKYKLKHAFQSSMVGQFFCATTPFATGGQPMQIYAMSKQKVEPGIAASMLMQKFIVHQISLVTFDAIAILILFRFMGKTINNIMIIFAVFGFLSQAFIIFLLFMFSFNRRVTHKVLTLSARLLSKLHLLKKPEEKIKSIENQLLTFHKSNREMFKNKKLLTISYSLTAVQLTAMFIIPYCIYRSFNLYGAKPLDMICSQAFVTMASCFMPVPGAAGASEISFLGFFSMYFPPETLKPAVLLWRVITYYGVILFTAPFSRLTKDKEE